MQNSVVMLTFCFWWKIPFLGIFCPKYQNCVPRLRALSHMKLHHGVKFLISTRVEKKLVSHVSFNPGQNKYFFTSFHPRVKLYLQRFATYSTKMLYRKSTFHMQLQDYIQITHMWRRWAHLRISFWYLLVNLKII